MVECVDIRANLHFGGRKAKLADLVLTGTNLSWKFGKKEYSYPLEFVVGAALDMNSSLKLKVCIFNSTKHKFKEYKFYCLTPDQPAQWVEWIQRFTYTSNFSHPRKIAVIVNPISGGKKGKKRFNKLFLPIVRYTPLSYARFGKI
jgi:hypothetical protein